MVRNSQYILNGNSEEDQRISILLILIYLVSVVFIYQFFSRSVLKHDEIAKVAQNQYVIEEQLPSERGKIYVKDSAKEDIYYPIALNEQKYQVLVVPKNIEDKEKTAEQLAYVLSLDYQKLFNEINNDKLYLPPIAEKLDREKIQEVLDLGLTGVLVMTEEDRIYPEDNLASQIVGFVDAEANGRYGIEGYYNQELTGISGEIVAEQDILGRLISIGEQTNPQDGSDIYTTIDRNIEYMTYDYLKKGVEEMQAESGMAIVVDTKTGNILSMAAVPDYNPNTYYETAEEHADYFTNPVISRLWEPGSIMKPIVMSMAINDGKVEPDTKDKFGANVWVQGYEIRNANDDAFGNETMTQVLENSDNVAMVWVSNKMSNEEMRDYFEKYGFGAKTMINLDGEATTDVLQIDLWRDISRATMSFGQGISVTPVQMIMAYAAIANDGILLKPNVVEKIIKADGSAVFMEKEEIRQVVTEDTANKIKDMMVSVVDNGHATSAQVAGYKIAGKTGTAQIPDDEGGYKENEYIHSFCGFFPADDPQFAALVILEKPKTYKYAATTTAPIFGDIAQWLLNYYQIQPTE